jgi:hypothetical protein
MLWLVQWQCSRTGYQRFTEAVDILVTRDDMQRLSDQVDGHNYVQPVGASTKLRDTRTGVGLTHSFARNLWSYGT